MKDEHEEKLRDLRARTKDFALRVVGVYKRCQKAMA